VAAAARSDGGASRYSRIYIYIYITHTHTHTQWVDSEAHTRDDGGSGGGLTASVAWRGGGSPRSGGTFVYIIMYICIYGHTHTCAYLYIHKYIRMQTRCGCVGVWVRVCVCGRAKSRWRRWPVSPSLSPFINMLTWPSGNGGGPPRFLDTPLLKNRLG